MSQEFDPKKVLDLLPQEVARILSQLSDIEKTVIEKVFGLGGDAEPKSHEIIASELNMSVDDVADIEQRAMNRLRHPSSE